MNRLIYLIPLASFPLMALAEQGPEDSMKTDNPYVAAALIFVVCLSVAIALAVYFNFRNRGRVACGVVFGMIDWLVTGPICISAGVSAAAGLTIASISALLIAFTMIRFGERLASFFRRHRPGPSEYDSDRD
jgi:Na+/proline symporter